MTISFLQRNNSFNFSQNFRRFTTKCGDCPCKVSSKKISQFVIQRSYDDLRKKISHCFYIKNFVWNEDGTPYWYHEKGDHCRALVTFSKIIPCMLPFQKNVFVDPKCITFTLRDLGVFAPRPIIIAPDYARIALSLFLKTPLSFEQFKTKYLISKEEFQTEMTALFKKYSPSPEKYCSPTNLENAYNTYCQGRYNGYMSTLKAEEK